MKTAILAVIAAVGVSEASAFTLVDGGTRARIVVGESEPEFVWLAVSDLTNDVKKIAGADLELVRGASAAKGDVFISTVADGRWEAYAVKEVDGALRISGSDARGTMFGVYDFIERHLGVDPMGFWSDVAHPSRKTLAWDKVEIEQGEPTFRFRGWFLNDEDLLTKWQENSGIRDYSTYRYYNGVVSHAAMEAVAEALVRSRMNLVIPASLLNISRPAEEALVAICARRGVYVSMHHIEPMGVSGYAFKDYWKKRGRELDFSYFKHKAEMEEVWRENARRWAKYPNVIWQIGLRGTADRPMWNDDPTMPKDDAGRAKLISAALARQIEILDELGVPKEGRVVSTTLWAEGAYFNAKGLLEIPKGTIVVLADNNCGWKWQKDLLEGPRAPGLNYGVYYHHQLIGMGPHIASLVPASKTKEMLVTAREKGASQYAIFNVGNVREFVYGIDASAKMTWNLDAFDPEVWTEDWLKRRVPSNVPGWLSALNVYHRSLQLQPGTGIPCFLDGELWYDYMHRMGRIKKAAASRTALRPADEPAVTVFPPPATKDPFKLALADMHPPLASPSDTYARLAAQRASYEHVLRLAERAMGRTDRKERRFAQDFLVYPAKVMFGLTEASMQSVLAEEAFQAGEREAAVEALQAAEEALQAVVDAGEDYCHDEKWRFWYRGCEKVAPLKFLRQTREAIEEITRK